MMPDMRKKKGGVVVGVEGRRGRDSDTTSARKRMTDRQRCGQALDS